MRFVSTLPLPVKPQVRLQQSEVNKAITVENIPAGRLNNEIESKLSNTLIRVEARLLGRGSRSTPLRAKWLGVGIEHQTMLGDTD